MSKSKLSAFISLLLVFVSGALVGALAHRLYMVTSVNSTEARNRSGPPPEEVRRKLVAEFRDRVKLDDEQVRQLNQIYDEERQQFDTLHQKFNAEGRKLRAAHAEKIRAILRPDQIPLFEKLQAEREATRKLRMQDKQGKK